MRVVHLIDSGLVGAAGASGTLWSPADLELRACGVLKQAAEFDQRLVLLGPASAQKRAEHLGISPDLLICPPLGRPELAWRVLHRAAVILAPDVVHCWSESTVRLAKLAFRRSSVYIGCKELAPPVHANRTELTERAAARAALRGEGIADSTCMLALLGCRRDADALRFLYVLGSLQYAGVDVVGLIPAWAQQLQRALRFARRFGSRIKFVVRDAPMGEVLRGADLAIWNGEESMDEGVPASWFIAEAHAQAVPVVTAGKAGVVKFFPESASGFCLAANTTPPELARLVMPIIEDMKLRERISRDVQGHLADMDCPRRLCEQVTAIWQGSRDGRTSEMAGAHR